MIVLAELGLLPDRMVRSGIRRLLRRRIGAAAPHDPADRAQRRQSLLAAMRRAPIALQTEASRRQHYEVAPEFFQRILGRRMKYSSGLWTEGVGDLDAAEEAMLRITCERADIVDGQCVLDLGCGWGALSLWIAEHYPRCRVLAVSHSVSQRLHIAAQASARGLQVEIVTADVCDFVPEGRFDRIVSVEMFEHMRNWQVLLQRIAGWLADDGRLFVHVFCHRHIAYFFEEDGRDDWMARHFFSGGMMPAEDLLPTCAEGLAIEAQWWIGGQHYARTLEAWLARLDAAGPALRSLVAPGAPPATAARQLRRWRLFLMACAETFALDHGAAWGVAHYRLGRPTDSTVLR